MSYAAELMDEFRKDEPAQETQETKETQATEAQVEDKPAEETPAEEHQEEPKPAEEDPKPADDKPTEEEQPAEEKPAEQKPDLSKLSKEEKASHAFARQLAKQKEKHKAELDAEREAMKKEFQAQLDEFKKTLQTKEEVVKKRDDFDSDDEYIDYLTQRGVDRRMAAIDAENAKQKAEKEKQAKAEAEAQEQQRQVADFFNNNARRTFGDNYGAFEAQVQKGVANGLADVLDEAPAVRDYIFTNPNGPAVLKEMLDSKESFVRVMSLAANPMDAVIECHELARELATRGGSQQAQDKPRMPNIGKPGAGGSTRTAPDMYSDDDALIDFVRKHR